MPSTSAGGRPGSSAVLSFHAAGALTSFTWLATDASRAPDLAAREVISRAAAAQMTYYDDVVEMLAGRVEAPHSLIDPYLLLLEEVAARTVPADWGERLLRTTVMGGMVRDLDAVLAQLLAPADRERARATRHDPGKMLAGLLTPALAADDRLRARLSLWGRRLAGEALGMLPPVVAALVAAAGQEGGENRAEAAAALHTPAMAAMSQGHAERMAALGLAA